MDLERLIVGLEMDPTKFDRVIDDATGKLMDFGSRMENLANLKMPALQDLAAMRQEFDALAKSPIGKELINSAKEVEKQNKAILDSERNLLIARVKADREAKEEMKKNGVEQGIRDRLQVQEDAAVRGIRLAKHENAEKLKNAQAIQDRIDALNVKAYSKALANQQAEKAAAGGGSLSGIGRMGMSAGGGYVGIVMDVLGPAYDMVKTVLSSLGDVVSSVFSKVVHLTEQAISTAIELGVQYQRDQAIFEAMTGSQERGTKLLAEVKKQAIATPYTFRELADAGQILMGSGTKPESILPILERLGDIAAGSSDRLRRLSLDYAHVVGLGRLAGYQQRSFANLGVGAEDFAKTMGKSVPEFLVAMHRGEVGADVMIKTLNRLTNEGGRFANLSERVNKQVGGQWNALSETVQYALEQIAVKGFERFDVAGKLGMVTALFGDPQEMVGQIGPMLDWVESALDRLKDLGLEVADSFKEWWAGGFGDRLKSFGVQLLGMLPSWEQTRTAVKYLTKEFQYWTDVLVGNATVFLTEYGPKFKQWGQEFMQAYESWIKPALASFIDGMRQLVGYMLDLGHAWTKVDPLINLFKGIGMIKKAEEGGGSPSFNPQTQAPDGRLLTMDEAIALMKTKDYKHYVSPEVQGAHTRTTIMPDGSDHNVMFTRPTDGSTPRVLREWTGKGYGGEAPPDKYTFPFAASKSAPNKDFYKDLVTANNLKEKYPALFAYGQATADKVVGKAEIPWGVPLDVRAQKLAQTINDHIQEGIDAFDKFKINLGLIEKASLPTKNEKGEVVEPALNAKARQEALVQQWQQVAKAYKPSEIKLPGLAYADSQEAQDVVNKSMNEQKNVRSVQEEMNETLHRIEEEAGRLREIAAQEKDIIEKWLKVGIIKVKDTP